MTTRRRIESLRAARAHIEDAAHLVRLNEGEEHPSLKPLATASRSLAQTIGEARRAHDAQVPS